MSINTNWISAIKSGIFNQNTTGKQKVELNLKEGNNNVFITGAEVSGKNFEQSDTFTSALSKAKFDDLNFDTIDETIIISKNSESFEEAFAKTENIFENVSPFGLGLALIRNNGTEINISDDLFKNPFE